MESKTHDLVKSTLLDIRVAMLDNRGVVERLSEDQIKAIADMWKLGCRYYDDGYEDMGFGIQTTALEKAMRLDEEDRIRVVALMFPEQEHGN